MPGDRLRRAERTHEPGSARLLWRATWAGALTPAVSARRRWRVLRLRRGNVDRARRWWSRPLMVFAAGLVGFLALVFLAWLARCVYVVVIRKPWDVFPNADSWCANGRIGVSCGAITGWITSLLSIALASCVFLLWRFSRAQRRYLRQARKRPRDLVPTAGPIFGTIVGRDDLCRVIMEDLRDPRERRPHVLVGGVGTGKTAVLVRLTAMLAERNAVAVPIRLRDEAFLDFGDLAKKRFLRTLDARLSSAAEGEKIWRRLLRDGRVAVLADGLEEALRETADEEQRDAKIRLAIHEAREQGLPLLITSRPHAPLQDMDATIYELEPLNQDDALDYVQGVAPSEGARRLRWIMGAADVAEAPLYLQITKDIFDTDKLDQVAAGEPEAADAWGHDRSQMRLRLLQTWENALICGDLHPEVPLKPEDRRAVLTCLSALACAGLKNDSLEVRLDTPLGAALGHEVEDARMGMRLAVAWGARLGLVEPLTGGVRFQHSLMQSYLGSRMMHAALTDPGYLSEALTGSADETAGGGPARAVGSAVAAAFGLHSPDHHQGDNPRPGREFLIALVLYSRQLPRTQEAAPSPPRSPAPASSEAARQICAHLAGAARGLVLAGLGNKALDIYAAALEISAVAGERRGLVSPAKGSPPGFSRALLPAHAQAGDGESRAGSAPARGDSRAPVLVGAAGQAPASRSVTLQLAEEISGMWREITSGDLQTLEEAKLGLVRRFGEALRGPAGHQFRHAPGDASGYGRLYAICCQEDLYRVRLAAAQEIGLGGLPAQRELAGALSLPDAACPSCRARFGRGRAQGGDGSTHRARQVSAWLAPLLVASVGAAASSENPDEETAYQQAKEYLGAWLAHLHPEAGFAPDQRHPGPLSISEEIALAQGLKYAANRRPGRVHTMPRACGHLQTATLQMLKQTGYWFSQLTLIQALCLWELQRRECGGEAEANPGAIVNHWLNEVRPDRQGDTSIHPFVQAAAVLASRALETGRPERFLWMDESDAVARVGSIHQARGAEQVRGRWILPSMGWSGLDSRAQQLLADVVLLLNLAERGGPPEQVEQWLRRADRRDLPLCVKGDRRAMKPDCTVGTAEKNPPGSSCLGDCAFDLCPYPPKGLQRPRAELGEAFCRHQATLVHRWTVRRQTARWQGQRAGQMRKFWSQLADRARAGSAH